MATAQATNIASRIPGPRPVPLIGWRGNLLPLLREPIPYMLHLHEQYGDLVDLSPGKKGYMFVFSPEYNRQVLSDQQLFYNGDLDNSPVRFPRDAAAVRLFSGLTTMNSSRHTQQRRLLMPAFHKRRIEALRDTMLSLTESHLARWQPGDTFDLLREMKTLTLAVAVQTILGLDPAREGEQVRGMMEKWLRLALSFSVIALPFNVPGTTFHRMLALSESLEDEIRAMLARRRGEDTHGHLDDASDALAMLLQAHDEDGTRLTDDELIGQTTTLFVAGHETTTSALTWTLFLLSMHPPVLHDLLDELSGTLHGAPPTVEQMDRMPLLDAVIKESMRLMPPGLWFLRVATAPTSFDQYSVPEGTRILWSPALTHRRPELYPDPNSFNPRRWETIRPSPYEYLPFGAGPRRCLGAVFATMEMKIILPVILQRFSVLVRPGAKIDLAGSPLATPKGGMPVRVTRPGRYSRHAHVSGNINELVNLA